MIKEREKWGVGEKRGKEGILERQHPTDSGSATCLFKLK